MFRSLDITDRTLAAVLAMIEEEEVPIDAVFEYDVCGSHQVVLTWDQPEG